MSKKMRNMKCKPCEKRTEHWGVFGPWINEGTREKTREEKWTCMECGDVKTQAPFPDLLGEIFGVPMPTVSKKRPSQAKRIYVFNKRVAHVEKDGRQ